MEYLDAEAQSPKGQDIRFVMREGVSFPFNKGAHEGTTVQEVLRVLIDRTKYLLAQIPCMETEAALGALEAALALYEIRAARRHERILDLMTVQELSCLPVCPNCGHIKCVIHPQPQ